VINNPRTARVVAVVVIAMLVITLAASLFGCTAKPSADYTDNHYKTFRRIAEDRGAS